MTTPRFALVLLCTFGCLSSVRAQDSEQLYFLAGSMPSGRQMMGAAAVGDYLYVISGADNTGYTGNVLHAPISSDGILGAWQETTPLPVNRSYIGNCTLTVGNVIYVAGGNIHQGNEDTRGISARETIYSRQNPDGTLGPWQLSPPFPGPPVQCNAAVTDGRFIYVLGGADDNNNPMDVVYRAPILGDGSVGNWVQEVPMPYQLWFHCAGLIGGRIYVWGGATPASGQRSDQFFAADLRPDGSIGSWYPLPPFPVAFAHGQAVTVEPFLINFAGIQPGRIPNESIFFNLITPQGPQGWQPVLVQLPVARYASAAYDPVRSIVYLVGGRTGATLNEGTTVPDVFAFRVLSTRSAAPPPQMASARPTPSPTPAPTRGPAPDVQWHTVLEGFRLSQQSGRNMLVVLGSPEVPAAMEFWNTVILDPGFGPVAERYVNSVVDVSQDPSVAMQLGIFKLPAVVVVTPQGRIGKTLMGEINLNDLRALP